MNAVVLDLFGTLVAAPTAADRSDAANRLARVIGCDPDAVERYFLGSWQARHDGTLPTVAALARHLVRNVKGLASAIAPVANELHELARPRLVPDTSVVAALLSLWRAGYRLGLLSDASADIAEAWPTSPLAAVLDTAVFSCSVGHTKPDQRLYAHVSHALGVPADQTLYFGDGGGDELTGAANAGMTATAIHRRGGDDALVFGTTPWCGPVIEAVEQIPAYVAGLR